MLKVNDKIKNDFTLVEEGYHPAKCLHVEYNGEEEIVWKNKTKKIKTIFIIFEVGELTIKQKYTLSSAEGSNLYKQVCQWTDNKMSTEEMGDFDLETLVGLSATIEVVHNESKDGKIYQNIKNIYPDMYDYYCNKLKSALTEKEFDILKGRILADQDKGMLTQTDVEELASISREERTKVAQMKKPSF